MSLSLNLHPPESFIWVTANRDIIAGSVRKSSGDLEKFFTPIRIQFNPSSAPNDSRTARSLRAFFKAHFPVRLTRMNLIPINPALRFLKHRGFCGFTAIELVVALVILAALIAILVPAAIENRRNQIAQECKGRVAAVNDAKKNWYGRDYSSTTESPTWDQLVPAYLNEKLTCPTGAEIILGGPDEACTCSSGLKNHAGSPNF